MLLVSSRRSEEVGAEACLQVRGVHAHSVVFVRAVMSEADSGLTADSTRPGRGDCPWITWTKSDGHAVDALHAMKSW